MQKILLSATLMISRLAVKVGELAWSADDDEAETEEVKTQSAYIPLGDPLVLNLNSPRSRNANLLIKDVGSEDIIKAHIPAILHILIVFLSEQLVKDMKAPTQRGKARQPATPKIQALVTELSNNEDIGDVLFPGIPVQ